MIDHYVITIYNHSQVDRGVVDISTLLRRWPVMQMKGKTTEAYVRHDMQLGRHRICDGLLPVKNPSGRGAIDCSFYIKMLHR